VMIGTAVGHTLEEYFPNPERFDIDRYTQARGEHRQRGAYVPFGAGNHRCLGSGLVPVQLCLTMATILRELELEPVAPDHELRVRSLPTMQPVRFRIRVLRRRTHDVATTGC
ncbi:MAG: cytochrome P450, partial [Proteobacteria bacterium]|nr:cytochrome P450 [Pseudomonadota bacterium]